MKSILKPTALVLVLVASAALAQVPPPPAPPGQEELAHSLIAHLKAKDASNYAALLSNDVHVYEDGKLVARNKAEWLRRFVPTLRAKGVTFQLRPGYSSTGRLLFIEYTNSLASWGRTPPPDCCWKYDAVAYDIHHGKIVTIRRLTGGAIRLDDNGNPL